MFYSNFILSMLSEVTCGLLGTRGRHTGLRNKVEHSLQGNVAVSTVSNKHTQRSS